ncbi:MAG: 30S ribosomal protein S6 [Candidatus Omnitrophota bacterium]|nr:30S ribosomal protein S6 [Candidatus Omnitrophota bacterium]
MRKYEIVFIFHPDLEEDRLKKRIEDVEKYIVSQKGKTGKIKDAIREKLPYPIKKSSEGLYVIFDFEMPPTAIDELKKKFLKDENILRYTVIKK